MPATIEEPAARVASPSAFIRRTMAERRLRKIDLMKLTGLSRASVDRHAEGRVEPNLDQRAMYAQAFGMTPSEFETAWLSGRMPTAAQSQASAFV